MLVGFLWISVSVCRIFVDFTWCLLDFCGFQFLFAGFLSVVSCWISVVFMLDFSASVQNQLIVTHCAFASIGHTKEHRSSILVKCTKPP